MVQIRTPGKDLLVLMYNEYLDYIWKAEKENLEFEISKSEGQLRNCRFRMGLLKREMIVCISLVVVPGVVALMIPNLPVNSGFRILDHLLDAATATVGLVAQTFYLVLLPFLIYFMARSIIKYRLNSKEQQGDAELAVLDRFRREPPEPEESYATEETKLIKILSIYYEYRKQMEQLREKLISGELTLTADELKQELDKLVYYEEIMPMNPHSQMAAKKVKRQIILLCLLIGIVFLLWPYVLGIFK